jgi:hypothetical protein
MMYFGCVDPLYYSLLSLPQLLLYNIIGFSSMHVMYFYHFRLLPSGPGDSYVH